MDRDRPTAHGLGMEDEFRGADVRVEAKVFIVFRQENAPGTCLFPQLSYKHLAIILYQNLGFFIWRHKYVINGVGNDLIVIK